MLLLVVGGLAELATIGMVFPFLALIIPGATDARAAAAVHFLDSLAVQTGYSRLAVATALLIFVALASAGLRLLLTWSTYKFVFGAARDLGFRLYDRMLHQSYAYHVMRNSSHTISGLEKVQHVLAYVLIPMILALTAFGVALFVIAAMVALDPVVALVGGMIFIVLYAGITLATKKRLESNSNLISSALQLRVQAVQEGLGGIRDIILDRSQSVFLDKFDQVERRFRRAQTVNYFVSSAPRFAIEAAIVIAIALLALYMSARPGGIVAAVPLLGAMAIGGQRLLPLVQQMYATWSQVSSSKAIVFDVVELINAPMPAADHAVPALPFTSSIELADVSFRYPSGEQHALNGISLELPKGIRLGVIGKSGSGKSTLVDIVMALLDPTSGEIRIDGRPLGEEQKDAWRRRVAHVPQAIYLSDASIAANIAFGRDPSEIDMERVRRAARDADIADHVESLSEGYDAMVGERGVRLSGGQRQRLGIARALYKGADVLILDEATSALDDNTEAAILDSIGKLSSELTIVMIAHRLTTLRGCDRVIELVNGRIARSGTYDEVVGSRGVRPAAAG